MWAEDVQYLADDAAKKLTGRTIKKVIIFESPEFGDQWVGFELDNGLIVHVLRDPEGNGPGWLQFEDGE